jgi:two-component system response regulator YesN
LFTVVVIEDEPTALEHVCTLLKMKCPRFHIAGVAEDGAKGLDIIRQFKPDLVITDVRMPLMDGISLFKTVREELPFIHFVIISGHQDFEYVKSAMKLKALDYILKPVSPGVFQSVMDGVADIIEKTYNQNLEMILQHLDTGDPVEEALLKKYFSDSGYYIAIIRQGGLPRRFSTVTSTKIDRWNFGVYILHGRDENEIVFVCPCLDFSSEEFRQIICHNIEGFTGKQYTTSIVYTKPVLPTGISAAIKMGYSCINNHLIVGHTSIIYIEGGYQKPTDKISIDETTFIRSELLAKNGDIEGLKTELEKFLSFLSKQNCPQLQMENFIKDFFSPMLKQENIFDGGESFEYMFEDAFYYAPTLDGLTESLFDIADSLMQSNATLSTKLDTKLFFDSVRSYMIKNLSSPISLQLVCKTFGISQSYLCRMFRKYTGQSFNEFLTECRIGHAKKLLLKNPDMLIKDVAQISGYSDQFYFSRLFRSVTGMSPSEFASR